MSQLRWVQGVACLSFCFRHTFGGRIGLRPCVSLCCFSFQSDCKVVENLPQEHMTVGVLVWPGSRGWDQADLLALSAEDHVAMVTSLASEVIIPCLLLRAYYTQVLERPNSLVLAPVSLGEYLRQRNGATRVFLSDLSSLYVQPSWL